MSDVSKLLFPLNPIKNGDIVTLLPSTKAYTSKSPQVLQNSIIYPSGTFGQTDDGYLKDRYHRWEYGDDLSV